MYRVITILAGALTLAACSSTPSWMSFDALKPEPIKDSVTLETSPPGAVARAASGETCTTPCALALPANAANSVTFTLAGHAPATEAIELVPMGDGTNRLQPNPLQVELAVAAPPPRAPATSKKKPAQRRPAAAAKPATQAATAGAAPAATTAAAPASPWPGATPAR
jgi:hypothetical protein